MPESKASPRRIAAAERQAKALELRKAGLSYDAIAKKLGYKHRDCAHSAVQAALKGLKQDSGKEVLKLELERLDRLFAGIWKQARDGDLEAMDRIMKLMTRMGQLCGIDAKEKVEHTGEVVFRVEVGDNLDPTITSWAGAGSVPDAAVQCPGVRETLGQDDPGSVSASTESDEGPSSRLVRS